MTKTTYIELLEELVSNLESEIRLTAQTYKNDNDEISLDSIANDLENVFDCSNLKIGACDIEVME